jgi:hypothetical protein
MLDQSTIVSFNKDETPGVELRNFWPPEDGFVWSMGKWCEVQFEFELKTEVISEKAELVLDLDVFRVPPAFEGQNLMIYLNGLRVGTRRVTKRVTAFVEFDPTVLRYANTLVFDTPDATSPQSFDLSDHRVLGLQLFSLQVRYFSTMS